MGCRLRHWQAGDKTELVGIINNRKVQDNLRDGIPYPYTERDAEEFIAQMLSSDGSEVYAFAIEAEGRLVGSIAVYRQGNIHQRTGELGYYLGEPYWGRGYGTEAIRQICRHVFEATDIVRIFAEPFSYNVASRRALEKAGFRHEGTLRANAFKNGCLMDMEMYALTKAGYEEDKAKDGFLGGYGAEWWKIAGPNRKLVSRYNSMEPDRLWDKYLLLKELLGRVDEETIIEAPFHCDDGKNIFLGKQFYANFGLIILDAAPVTFGDHVIVGPNVTFCAASHPIHPESRLHNGQYSIMSAPINVGDDVWIGAGVTVLPGVTIGSGSVIGAGSVVTKDIPPMVVAAGTPCRVLRDITDADRYVWPDERG